MAMGVLSLDPLQQCYRGLCIDGFVIANNGTETNTINGTVDVDALPTGVVLLRIS